MSNPDFKIQETYCADEMVVVYKVLELTLLGDYYYLRRFTDLETAKNYVRMLRKYNRGAIYHLVD